MKILKIRILHIFAIVALLAVFSSCQKPSNPKPEGNLSFSTDTVSFDTLFTTIKSPTQRLKIYNNSGNDMLIQKVKLLGGSNSEFSVNFDGIDGTEFADYVLANGDSAHIFISLKSNEKEKLVQDRLEFIVGGSTQYVEIEGFVRDAYFYRDSIVCDHTLPVDKPIVIDGYLAVPENCKLTIPAGAHLFFSQTRTSTALPISRIYVEGTLEVNGSSANPVIMEGNRLEEDYDEQAGQWYGLIFWNRSKNNIIQNCLIKNATNGIEFRDSLANTTQAKLQLSQVEIRNCSQYGIIGFGLADNSGPNNAISAENVLVHNCAAQVMAIAGGGNYQFTNCTFANFTYGFSRQDPMLLLLDYFSANGLPEGHPGNYNFTNCIVWGTEDNEISMDFQYGGNHLFENCILKNQSSVNGTNNFMNQNPSFINESNNDNELNYRLRSSSIAIDAGKNVSLTIDLDGNPRPVNVNFDIGAYEWQP